MATEGSGPSGTTWPMPTFRFEVDWGGARLSFQEVSGPDVEAQPIEYRAGDSRAFSVVKMPGIKQYSDVTMKKGMFKGDMRFSDWLAQVRMNSTERKAVRFSLLDEDGRAVMVWKLTNAWPTKISGTDLKSSANEVAIETIVLAHEGLEIEGR